MHLLNISGRLVTKIENLPNSLKNFDCGYNKITKIENLPNSLLEFYCYNNEITKIENLPTSLEVFYFNGNKITKIENLPTSLEVFCCGHNQITKIENLPTSLRKFWCGDNQITKIENLPNSLQEFDCSGNIVTMVDNLELSRFNKGVFDLGMYQSIKRLQRRIRLRYKRKIASAKVIQQGCCNCLYSAKYRDGSNGLGGREGYKRSTRRIWNVLILKFKKYKKKFKI